MTARLLILAFTVSILFAMWCEPKRPSNITQVDYCVISRKAAAYDEEGKLHFGWVKGYGPCSEQDIYRNI